MVLAGPGGVWQSDEGLSGEAGDWSSVDGQMLIKSTIDKLLQLILAQLSIIFTVIKNWIDRVNEEYFKSDNSLSGQGGVWHGDEGICGEWSSDGHAVSVDHRGTADGDMLIKSCQSSNVAADLERIYQLFQ